MRVSETVHGQFELPFLSFASWWSAFLFSRRASWHGGKDCSVGPWKVDLLPRAFRVIAGIPVTASVLLVMVSMRQRKKSLGPAADLPSGGPVWLYCCGDSCTWGPITLINRVACRVIPVMHEFEST